MGIVSVSCPMLAGRPLRIGKNKGGGGGLLGEGCDFSHLAKMNLIEDHFIGMSNAPEPSNESQ